MRNISHVFVEKITTHSVFSNLPPPPKKKNPAIYEVMWENIV